VDAVTSAALQRALTDPGQCNVRPLLPAAAELLVALDAPPRLAAHLRAVHHVAHGLTDRLTELGLRPDRGAVIFGAATHDIGKVHHVEELTGPGHAHESAGHAILLQYGIPLHLARFAATHGSWWSGPRGSQGEASPAGLAGSGRTIEDLLVSVADTVWKGRRIAELEQRVLDHLVAATDLDEWDGFLRLDDILASAAQNADDLLTFQFSHPVSAE
jgi:hypothetical protein